MFSDIHEEREHRLVEETKKQTAENILNKVYYFSKDCFIDDEEEFDKFIKNLAREYEVEIKENDL